MSSLLPLPTSCENQKCFLKLPNIPGLGERGQNCPWLGLLLFDSIELVEESDSHDQSFCV